MNTFSLYLTSLAVTLILVTLLTLVLRRALRRILVDLCGTEERAHFWTLFSMVILVAMPMVIGMGYTPEEPGGPGAFFEMARQVRGNLLAYLFALAVVGMFLSLFTLFASRPKSREL